MQFPSRGVFLRRPSSAGGNKSHHSNSSRTDPSSNPSLSVNTASACSCTASKTQSNKIGQKQVKNLYQSYIFVAEL